MEMQIKFYDSVQTAVPFFPTDNEDDLMTRIAVIRQTPSGAIYTPIGFDWKEFVAQPSKHVLLDLFSILPNDFFTNNQEAYALYNRLQKKYTIGIVEFTEQYIVKNIWDTTINVNAIESRLIFNWFPKFKTIRDKLEEWWSKIQTNKALLSQLVLQYKNSEIQDVEKNKKAVSIGEKFVSTPTIPTEDEEIIGYIERFHVATTETTGSLFDEFVTTPTFPLARYKTFFKIHNNVSIKPLENETTQDTFHDLQIFNKTGDVNIHIKNTTTGIIIQALIADELKSITDVMTMLRLDDPIDSPQRFGLRIQFNLKNVCFDPSVFSDMVLNDAVFRKFLSVNDTDKISRQNKSVYIYFRDPNLSTNLSEKDILVGGWNRAFSRYGDLTAIIQCEPDGKNYKILVRVVRSIDDTVVESFKEKIGIFFRLYESMLPIYIQMYKEFLPSFEPYQPTIADEKEMDNPLALLMKAEPKIFLSNIYGRNCQKVKPIIIEDPEQIEALSPARKLLFPPVEYDGMKPRYYTCPTTIVESEGVPYLYPGLKKIKKEDHPFGYFPCCYKEDTWEKKNAAINNKIIKKLTDQSGDENDGAHKKNIEHIITRKSIIDNLGQLGTLPELLENFFLTINPFQKYYRLGVPLMDSFISCLEYQHSMKTGKSMRNMKDIRQSIVDSDKITVGFQENYDIGIDGIVQLLKDDKSIDPKRFIRIMENYYDVSIYIFYKDRDDKINLLIPHEDRSYYRYYHDKRPIVAIFQHWGGTMDELIKLETPHCELIIAQKFNTQRVYTFNAQQFSWRALSELGFNFFDGGRHMGLTSIDDNNLLAHVTQQLIDPLGKTRFFFFSEKNFPAYVTTPVAPLAIPVVSTVEHFPPSPSVYKFLTGNQIKIKKIVEWKKQLFFYVRVRNMEMIFPSLKKSFQMTPPITDLKHESFDIRTILSIVQEQEMILVFQEKIRLSSILQDYYLYYMATFIQENDITTMDIDNWITDFMDQHTHILKNQNYPYPPVVDIPVSFQDTVSGVVKNKKILVVERVKIKMIYFLKWFYINRKEELDQLVNRREIPSYYQYTADFQKYPRQTIINTLQDVKNIYHYPYVQDVLTSIDKPFLTPFYYYNNYQTGEFPHIIVRLQTRQRAIEVLYIWHTQYKIDTRQHVDISDKNIIVDEPLDYVNGFLQWTSRKDAIGKISPAHNDSWLTIIEF